MQKVADFKVSRMGLGSWQAGEKGWGWQDTYSKDDVLKAFEIAFEMGVNFIDTSEDYGPSEEIMGELIKRTKRDDLFVATKVNKDHLRFDDLVKACDRSRRRLGVDVIDLYQIHDPSMYVPLKETMRGFDVLLREGKIRHVGLCNFPVALMTEAQSCLSRGEIVSNQVRYNLIQREVETEILPRCKKEKIAVVAFSPLAQGLLTGKYGPGKKPAGELRSAEKKPIFGDENLNRLKPLFALLRRLSIKYGRSLSQISINWLLRNEEVYPIPGVKNQKQAEDNVSAMRWRLDKKDWQALEKTSKRIKLSYFRRSSSWQ